MIVEIFGRKLEIVENNENGCTNCALKDFCFPREYPMPCKDSNGNTNRVFKQVKEKVVKTETIITK